jgi:hypothetical protein
MSAIPVEDRLDLQELVARYAFRCDTKLYSEIQHLFTDDGIFDETVIGLPLCTGRPAIHELFNNVGPAVDYLIHLNCNHQITAYNGTTANATSHLHVEGLMAGNQLRILGYYNDTYQKIDGAWLFKHRKLIEIAPSTGFTPKI